MFNKLFECINADDTYQKIQRVRDILSDVQELTAFFDTDLFIEEKKNDAIDAICEILQNYKKTKKE